LAVRLKSEAAAAADGQKFNYLMIAKVKQSKIMFSFFVEVTMVS